MKSNKGNTLRWIRPAPALVSAVTNIVRLLDRYSYNDKVLYIAQECLMSKLLEIEWQSKRYKEKAKRLRIEADKLPPGEKQTIRSLKSKAISFDENKERLKYEKWLLRYVGDGIAWHAYRHSRKHIRALSDKDPVNSLGKPEKFIYHRRLFRGVRHRGNNFLPVMHDITNCLRTGDLTVFERGKRFKFHELKIFGPAGKSSQQQSLREGRQALRLGRIRAYFETSQIRYLYPEYRRGKHVQAKLKEKYHFDVISRIMKKARTETFGCENPEEGLYYVAFDRLAKNEHEALRELQSKFPKAFESHFVRKLIDPYHDRDASVLPVTAMPLHADDILDILVGKIGVLTLINFEEIKGSCQRAGVPLEISVESGNTVVFVLKRRTQLLITPSLWERILLEFLSVDSFGKLLTKMPSSNGLIEGRFSDLVIEPYDPLGLFETIRFRSSLWWAEVKIYLMSFRIQDKNISMR